MTRKNRIFGLIGLLAVVIGFFSKTIYRDFVNLNGIDDYGIAGFLPSYFYVLGFALLMLFRPTKHTKLIVLIVTLSSILFELKQWNSTGKFDLNDILASIAGGITAILILIFIEKYLNRNKTTRNKKLS